MLYRTVPHTYIAAAILISKSCSLYQNGSFCNISAIITTTNNDNNNKWQSEDVKWKKYSL
jgi:hypothetical protein